MSQLVALGLEVMQIETGGLDLNRHTLDNLQIATVPEPATLSMVGLALLGIGAVRRYRRK